MNFLTKFEAELLDKGIELIAGVDEAGRGALAGPLVVASVVFGRETLEEYIRLTQYVKNLTRNNDVLSAKRENWLLRINDSKKLTKNVREALYKQIIQTAKAYKIVIISNEEIDKKGIAWANSWGFQQAITTLKLTPNFVLTDHFPAAEWPKNKQLNINKGDSLSFSIAGASILAKVYRDNLMVELNKIYPKYHFDKHKGYGTRLHKEMILREGPCKIHRQSFEPMKSLN